MDRFSSKVKDKNVKEFLEFLKNGWNLNDAEQVERETAKPITVWIALSRMWTLIGNEHWLLYVAFIALIVAAVCYFFFCFSSYLFALTNFRIVCFKTRLLIWSKYIMLQVSEISMPSILAASIFSAQRGETIVFLRSSRFLFMLCLTSGLCRLIYLWSEYY